MRRWDRNLRQGSRAGLRNRERRDSLRVVSRRRMRVREVRLQRKPRSLGVRRRFSKVFRCGASRPAADNKP